MRIWPFRRSQAEKDAGRLLAAVTEASRRSEFFGENRIADTLDGRFELLVLHAALALRRLRGAAEATALTQEFIDQLFSQLDAGLREDGVGDLIVPKRMQRLAGAFYGRVKAYEGAWDQPANLVAALARNAAKDAPEFAPALAGHALALAAQQAELPVSILITPEAWTPPDPTEAGAASVWLS